MLFLLEADDSIYKHVLRPEPKREVEEHGRVSLTTEEKERYVLMNDLWIVIFFASAFGSVFSAKLTGAWGTGFGFAFVTMAAGGAIEGFVIFRHKGAAYCAAMMALHAFLAVQGGGWSIAIPNIIG